MPVTLAVAGKGGVGKTTVAALAVKFLTSERDGAVLAIDADPSTNLDMVLGLDLEQTVGDIREEMLATSRASGIGPAGGPSGGISKREHLDYEIRASIAEGVRCDLVAMGRPEGPGCYCGANHHLRGVIDAIGGAYAYVVIDNEAGMEHLSRRTTRDVQHLLIVSDPTRRGVVTAGRIAALRHELDVAVERAYLVLNRVTGDVPGYLMESIDHLDVPLLGLIPESVDLRNFDVAGRSLLELPDSSSAYGAVSSLMEAVL